MTTITNVTASNSYFTVTTSDGESKKMTFAELVMSMGMMQLSLQEQYFEAQYTKTSQMADEMRACNDVIAVLTKMKGEYGTDNHKDYKKLSAADIAIIQNNRDLCIKMGIPSTVYDHDSGDSTVWSSNYQEFTTALTSAEAYQKNLSSLNEQQMMITNQAASRRSNVLQQLQTLLAAEKEGRSSAAR